VEGVGHTESDGVENSGNERKFHLRYEKVGQIGRIYRGMQLSKDRRSDRFNMGSNVLCEIISQFLD
jgi:hypothetical protein